MALYVHQIAKCQLNTRTEELGRLAVKKQLNYHTSNRTAWAYALVQSGVIQEQRGVLTVDACHTHHAISRQSTVTTYEKLTESLNEMAGGDHTMNDLEELQGIHASPAQTYVSSVGSLERHKSMSYIALTQK